MTTKQKRRKQLEKKLYKQRRYSMPRDFETPSYPKEERGGQQEDKPVDVTDAEVERPAR